jgi:transposase
MSQAEIISEIPKLSHTERREILRRIFEVEADAATLNECDRLALARFQMLDALEAEDEKNPAR